ncbi:helix-turn-helix domain-containing protein [Haloferax larsenii]|nr:hypothetical protein [Haloferax larsenii]
MPATAEEIADALGYKSTSGAYDIIRRLRKAGVRIPEPQNGVYHIEGYEAPTDTEDTAPGSVRVLRSQTSTKQSVSKKARDFLAELELDLKRRLQQYQPARADGGLLAEPGNEDMVFFRTDDHFGQTEHDQYGGETFNSDIAEDRVWQYVNDGLTEKERREAAGIEFDTAHLLLGGDIVTNETIYASQPHSIDLHLRGQIERASTVYTEVIKRLAEEFPTVQVVCQHGNHGELRTGGQSSKANADDIVYSMLDLAVRQSGLDNVTFIQNDATYFTNFEMRGHRGHIRHGHEKGCLEHIGTSSPKARWGSWLINNQFDVAYRGHYHEIKVEPIAGRPVIMGGSLQPAGDYEEGLGIASSRPAGIVHGVSDDEPLAWMKPVYFT